MPSDSSLHDKGAQTRAIHASQPFNETRAVTPPIWQTTTFSADTAAEFAALSTATRPPQFYTRYGNPTHQQVEATIAALEGGEAALVTGSGMGAIFSSVMANVSAGDHVVAQKNHYAGTAALLRDVAPRFGITTTFVDQTDPAAFDAAIQSNTRLVIVEAPANPLLQLTDLAAVAAVAKARGVTTLCDNTFATPVNQRPLELGIDVVIHSATKYLGGHGDVTAGVIVGTKAFLDQSWKFAIVAGATLSPFDGWLLLRGLRTIGLRVARHNENALALARLFAEHPAVLRVHYPGLASHPQHALATRQMKGFGGMVAVELRGGFEAADRFMSRVTLATRAASLGGFETLVVHPAAMWAQQMSPSDQKAAGISEGLVRVSVGLEDAADLLADFSNALEGSP